MKKIVIENYLTTKDIKFTNKLMGEYIRSKNPKAIDSIVGRVITTTSVLRNNKIDCKKYVGSIINTVNKHFSSDSMLRLSIQNNLMGYMI